ncbi:hypothetical protein [Spirosoma rigui]|uniref:hypothetical protein n=1 Tax=Spirosoma rigui TaxID=564064 RepID=UPI0009B1560E|nr:hypothetical protein [Spirosoma rigui]
MKRSILLILLFVPMFLTALVACKHSTDAQPAVCRLISTTDQLIEANGRLTDEMQRTFTYNNALLTSVAERSTNQEAGFLLERANQRVVRAANGATAMALAYESSATQPGSATFTQANRVMSTFTMVYNAAGRMTRIVESRSVLPGNSLTVARDFTFTYDDAGNLTTEQTRSTLIDGTMVAQQTEYTPGANPSPYTQFSERALLTVVALSQGVETRPGRFWHLNAPLAQKSYVLTSSGTRGNLRDSSTFAPVYDATNKLVNQAQQAYLFQLSDPTPVTKRNKQTYEYQCD